MKKLYLTLLSAICMLAFSAKAAAEDIDLGAIELGKTYELATFKNYIGTFTPETNGVVTVESTTNDIFFPYYAKLPVMETEGNKVPFTYNSIYAPRSLDFNVEAGKTYYMYANFVINSNTKVTVTMSDKQTVELTKVSQEPGSVYYFTNYGNLNFTFNKAIAFSEAKLISGDNSIHVSAAIFSNSLSVDVYDEIYDWLNSGKVKAGDEFTVEITGLCMASNKEVKYGDDGILRVKYLFCNKPMTLASTVNTNQTFLSYYAPGDDKGIVTLHFNQEVGSATKCELRYGNIDEDASGNYYVETLPVTVNGNSVSVNLQGKRRLPTDMVSNPAGYPMITLGFIGIRDKDGNLPYSQGELMNSSYWFNMDYNIITADVTWEFSPVSGSNIDNYSNIELWITDESKLRYDGIEFAYEKDGTAKSEIVTNFTKQDDTENPGAAILTIPVPADCKGAKNIVVSLHNLTCADGTDYSRMITAKYNAFVIKSATPVNNSTLEKIENGQTLKVSTNMNSSVGYLPFVLRNTNAAEGEEATVLTGVFTKPEGSSSFTYTADSEIILVKGCEYHLEFTAYSSEADFNEGKEPLGSDYVTYHGATVPYEYSTVLFSGITPEEGTLINKRQTAVFTLTFDGMVSMDSNLSYIIGDGGEKADFRSITPEAPDGQGYSNIWKLTVTMAQLSRMGSEINLHVSAKDYEGKIVEGNTGIDGESYLHFTYQLDDPTGISEINGATYTPSRIFRIDGTAVKATTTDMLPAGLYIVNGKKFVKK